jgi:Conserved region in glutamate synthase
VYGVFSGPGGGFAPREELCVGCLRCTVQYPEVVQIHHNPERARLGDSYLAPECVETILYEATTGRVPVRGAGYRGPFGGPGWDGMWLDMSEIVRPTRDGIHGREFISTSVDVGEKPAVLRLAEDGSALGPEPRLLVLQLPFLFDPPPPGETAVQPVLAAAARELETLALVPIGSSLAGPHVVPLVERSTRHLLDRLSAPPPMIALDGWDRGAFEEVGRRFPKSLVCVRVPADADVLEPVRAGARVLHLIANYHGQVGERFILDLVREAHGRLVEAGVREEVTLIGSGGIVLAEHVPKAIVCGLDAVALDTALWVALQGRFHGECRDRDATRVSFGRMTPEWGVARLRNLSASWRDQLLEVLGAMGMREVRRLRGELGRCTFQHELEREAFEGIDGYA